MQSTRLTLVAVTSLAAATVMAQPWRHGQSRGPTSRPAATPVVAPSTQPATATSNAAARGMMRMGLGPAGRGMRRGMGPDMGPGGDMAAIHSLLSAHEKLRRTVQDIPGGVQTVTTSGDPQVAALLRQHVAQMKARMAAGQPIRMWDPLFVELFNHRASVTLVSEDVPDGVKVVATSADPQTTLLIRQHARAGVSEFVSGGWDRVHNPTTLPAGYPQSARP